MAHQLDELLKGNVLHCPEVRVLLNTLLSHHTHHFLTSCFQGRRNIKLVILAVRILRKAGLFIWREDKVKPTGINVRKEDEGGFVE